MSENRNRLWYNRNWRGLSGGLLLLCINAVAAPPWSPPSGNVNCSDNHVQANFNEFVLQATSGDVQATEIKILGADGVSGNVDVSGWHLCMRQRIVAKCYAFGDGDMAINAASPPPDDSGVYSHPPSTYLVFDQPLNPTELEAIIFDANNEVVDYIELCKSTCGISNRWTVVDTPTASCDIPPAITDLSTAAIIARYPVDGTGPWTTDVLTPELTTPTPGADNSGGTATMNGFLITASSYSASTCTPLNITIQAVNNAGKPVTNYDGTITLTTSTGHGNWTVISATNPLVPSPDNDDNGTVQYTFDRTSDNGLITLALSNPHADVNLTVDVDDGGGNTGSVPNITFSDNVFVLTEDPLQVAGRDQAINVAMWQRDATSGNCQVAGGYNLGSQALKVWLSRTAADPGGTSPTVGASALPDGAPGSSNVTLDFSGGGSAILTLATTDVGQYRINLMDDSGGFASGTNIIGQSAPLTVRPFGFDIDFNDDRASNGSSGPSYAAGASGSVFAVASAGFSTQLSAVRWQAADDANDDGIPDGGSNLTDNGLTAAFGSEPGSYGVTVSHALVAPAGGVGGSLSGGALTAGGGASDFSGGVADISLSWDEVGIINLSAALSDYLGTSGANVSGAVVNVGRFTPARLSVSARPDHWSASTSYRADDIVAPTTANGHAYQVTVGGVSAASEPVWTTGGGSQSDGSVTWRDLGLITPGEWNALTAFGVGAGIYTEGHLFQAIAAGTSGASEPSWPVDGGTVVDGGVTWIDRGSLIRFANACEPADANHFTYLGQDAGSGGFGYRLRPVVAIEPRNADDNFTANYAGTFWKLADGLSSRGFANTAATAATLQRDVDGGVAVRAGDDYDAVPATLTVSGDSFSYTRPTDQEEPFDAAVTITLDAGDLTDGDGVCANQSAHRCTSDTSGLSPWSGSTAFSGGDRVVPTSANGHSYVVIGAGASGGSEPSWPTDCSTVADGGVTWRDAGPCATDFVAVDGARLRYGQGEAVDIYGTMAEVGDTLLMPVRALYYSASGWMTNVDDDCTTLSYTQSDSGITATLAPASPYTLSAGSGDLTATLIGDDGTPGGATSGGLTWPTWLAGPDAVTATFGIFRGDDRFFRWEEGP